MATKKAATKTRGPRSIDRGMYGGLSQLTVRVDDKTRTILQKLGNGSCSAGIRVLASSYGAVALADLTEWEKAGRPSTAKKAPARKVTSATRSKPTPMSAAEIAYHGDPDGDIAGADYP